MCGLSKVSSCWSRSSFIALMLIILIPNFCFADDTDDAVEGADSQILEGQYSEHESIFLDRKEMLRSVINKNYSSLPPAMEAFIIGLFSIVNIDIDPRGFEYHQTTLRDGGNTRTKENRQYLEFTKLIEMILDVYETPRKVPDDANEVLFPDIESYILKTHPLKGQTGKVEEDFERMLEAYKKNVLKRAYSERLATEEYRSSFAKDVFTEARLVQDQRDIHFEKTLAQVVDDDGTAGANIAGTFLRGIFNGLIQTATSSLQGAAEILDYTGRATEHLDKLVYSNIESAEKAVSELTALQHAEAHLRSAKATFSNSNEWDLMGISHSEWRNKSKSQKRTQKKQLIKRQRMKLEEIQTEIDLLKESEQVGRLSDAIKENALSKISRSSKEAAKTLRGIDSFLKSESGFIDLLREIHIHSANTRMIKKLIKSFEAEINGLLQQQLVSIPQRAMHSELMRSIDIQQDDQGKKIVNRVLTLLFRDYLPRLPPAILKDMIIDLISTTSEDYTDDVAHADFVAITKIAKHFDPFFYSIMQNIAEQVDSPYVKGLCRVLQDQGLVDLPALVLQTMYGEPIKDFVLLSKEDFGELLRLKEQHPFYEKFKEAKTAYVDLSLDAMSAGKYFQVHSAIEVNTSTLEQQKIVLRIQKTGMPELLRHGYQVANSLIPDLKTIFELAPGKNLVHNNRLEQFIDVQFAKLAEELDLQRTAVNFQRGKLRLQREISLSLKNQKYQINLKIPEVSVPAEGSKMISIEYVDDVGIDHFRDKHEHASRVLGREIYRAVYEELFLLPLVGHPMQKMYEVVLSHFKLKLEVVKSQEYVVTADGTKLSQSDLEALRFDDPDFLAGVNTTTTEDYLRLLRQLESENIYDLHLKMKTFHPKDGFTNFDPHAGNFRISKVSLLGDREASLIEVVMTDFGIIHEVQGKYLKLLSKLTIGSEYMSPKVIANAITLLANLDVHSNEDEVEYKNVLQIVKKTIRIEQRKTKSKVALGPGEWIYRMFFYHDIGFPNWLIALYQPTNGVADSFKRFGGLEEDFITIEKDWRLAHGMKLFHGSLGSMEKLRIAGSHCFSSFK